MIVRPRGSLWEHVCEICNASWVGYGDDDCYWCDKRVSFELESRRNRLLWPEWLGWIEQRLFLACSNIDRIVWAETRGFGRDYLSKWERELTMAVSTGVITDNERALALRRYAKWTTHLKKPDG